MDVAQANSIHKPESIVEEVLAAVGAWPDFATDAGVSEKVIEDIQQHHRLSI